MIRCLSLLVLAAVALVGGAPEVWAERAPTHEAPAPTEMAFESSAELQAEEAAASTEGAALAQAAALPWAAGRSPKSAPTGDPPTRPPRR